MNQPSQEPILTLEQKLRIGFNLASLPALSVLPFLRRGLGFRLLAPGKFLGIAIFLFLLGDPTREQAFAPSVETYDWANITPTSIGAPTGHTTAAPGMLGLFGIVMLLLAGDQRARRKREIKQGMVRHTYSRGTSIFARKGERGVAERYIDPLVCIIAGAVCTQISGPLGTWLILSGMCLSCVEHMIIRFQFERHLDVIDSLVESEAMAEIMNHYRLPHYGSAQIASADSISVTSSPDIHLLIAQREGGYATVGAKLSRAAQATASLREKGMRYLASMPLLLLRRELGAKLHAHWQALGISLLLAAAAYDFAHYFPQWSDLHLPRALFRLSLLNLALALVRIGLLRQASRHDRQPQPSNLGVSILVFVAPRWISSRFACRWLDPLALFLIAAMLAWFAFYLEALYLACCALALARFERSSRG